MEESKKRLRKRILLSVVVLLTVIAVASMISGYKTYAQQSTQPSTAGAVTQKDTSAVKFGFIAAAVAFGMGALGAGIAIANVGAAAMGAVAEKPEIAGQALIFIALAEGLVVFGFITALMILGKV
ncbi:MAG: ATPase [Spirochaetes bacterium]|nr:ATPase [Spirochaetota bacterium]